MNAGIQMVFGEGHSEFHKVAFMWKEKGDCGPHDPDFVLEFDFRKAT